MFKMTQQLRVLDLKHRSMYLTHWINNLLINIVLILKLDQSLIKWLKHIKHHMQMDNKLNNKTSIFFQKLLHLAQLLLTSGLVMSLQNLLRERENTEEREALLIEPLQVPQEWVSKEENLNSY